MGFSFDFFMTLWPTVLSGAVVTVVATLLGYVLALVLGLLLALCTLSRTRLISWPAQGVLQLVRNTPLLIQLYIWFYVLPDYGIVVSALTAGVIGLGIHYSTYLAEIYRSGIQNVPRGQWEASTALSLPRNVTWRRIVIPQAVRVIVPPLGNYLIGMYKSTPYLAAITVNEMLHNALVQGSLSFRYVEALVMVGLIFLVVSYASALLVRKLEKSLAVN